jgi:hypothetical protein
MLNETFPVRSHCSIIPERQRHRRVQSALTREAVPMKMLSLFAAAAGLALLGAAPPGMYGPGPGPGGYPPCSRTVTDRCIQLYERGVATPQNLALNERLGQGRMRHRYARGPMPMGPMGPMGMGPMPMGPRYGEMRERRVVVMARNDYPPCGGEVGDRCIQAPPAMAEAVPVRHRVYRAHYDRQLVRVGERG